MAKPIQAYGGPQYIVGPGGNKIGVRGGQVVPLPPTLAPVDVYDPPLLYPLDIPPRLPPVPIITHPHGPRKQPPVRHPMPPIRVPRPRIQPAPLPPRYVKPHHGRRHHGPRPHPVPVFGPPVYVPPVEPAPIVAASPVATGPICPSWGWMVKTNPDGSETVVRCAIGQPTSGGLHGLELITDSIQGVLGPNWMLYVGGALAAWFFLKRR